MKYQYIFHKCKPLCYVFTYRSRNCDLNAGNWMKTPSVHGECMPTLCQSSSSGFLLGPPEVAVGEELIIYSQIVASIYTFDDPSLPARSFVQAKLDTRVGKSEN